MRIVYDARYRYIVLRTLYQQYTFLQLFLIQIILSAISLSYNVDLVIITMRVY